MRPALLLLPALVLAVTTPARAQTAAPASPVEPAPHVAVRLSFKTVAGCPPERAFRAEVASWVGYDPFSAEGADLVTIWFERVGAGFSGSFTLTTPEGASGVHREVEASCTGLYRTMGIGVGLSIAPSDAPLPAAPAPAPAPEPAPAVATVAALPPPVVPPAPLPAKRNVGIHAGVDAVFKPMVAPSVSFGFAPSIGVRLREPAISIDLGLRELWSVRATVARNGKAYSWTSTSGVLAAAIHKSFFFGGPLVEIGTLTPHTNHSLAGTPTPAFVAVGLHAGIQRAVTPLVTLRTSIEVEYAAITATLLGLTATGRPLWTMPSFSAAVAAGVAFDLW